jgi:hypothetical protein
LRPSRGTSGLVELHDGQSTRWPHRREQQRTNFCAEICFWHKTDNATIASDEAAADRISASASATLAEDFGRDVRNLIASQEYAQVFDTRLAEDSQAKGRWMTSENGSYYACGVGSALMGRGAHVFLIDDPFGSMAEARSEVERKGRAQLVPRNGLQPVREERRDSDHQPPDAPRGSLSSPPDSTSASSPTALM